MVIIAPRLLKFFASFVGFPNTARGMGFCALFVIVRSKEEAVPWLITHETIHLKQQRNLLIIGVIFLDIVETLFALIVLRKTWYGAYLWRSSEQEAYLNQNDSNYLKNRKPFAQFTYLFHKKKFSHKDGVITYL